MVDLDKNTLEVYKGFNKSPLTEGERFYFLNPQEHVGGTDRYYPVKMIQTFSLLELPDTGKFVELCEPREEDE